MTNDSGTPGSPRRSRALVLGGGGPVGRAWQSGLIAGLIEREIDLGDASSIIGTSAGAVVGVQLALKQDIAAPPKADPLPPFSSSMQKADALPPLSDSMMNLAAAMARAAQSPEPEPARAEIGKMALSALTMSEEASLSRSIFAPFAGQAWPGQLRITTVNAGTGRFQVWDASSGAPLERAIAASTAAPCIWPPITINGERYIDGGVRSILNADLAIGSDIVIVVSCFPLTARDEAGPAFFKAMNAAPLAELDAVRGSGATLAVIEPHSDFVTLTKHGTAMMDSNLVPEAYRMGHMTGIGEAGTVRHVWNSK